MAATKVGLREFRHRFGNYAESNRVLAITKHGRTLGLYIPLRCKPAPEDLTAFREAGSALHALMAEKGVSESEVLEDLKRLRKAGKVSRV